MIIVYDHHAWSSYMITIVYKTIFFSKKSADLLKLERVRSPSIQSFQSSIHHSPFTIHTIRHPHSSDHHPDITSSIHGILQQAIIESSSKGIIGVRLPSHIPPSAAIRRETFCPPKHLKSMKINANPWKSIKINENRWKSMQIDENLCKSMQIYANLWKSMKIYENQWKSLKINENQWKSIKIHWNSWKLIKINAN